MSNRSKLSNLIKKDEKNPLNFMYKIIEIRKNI